MTLKHLSFATLSLLTMLILSGCIRDELEECPNDYFAKIVFERNMLNADAFASQVKSIEIKVFDHETGRQVYEYSESGEKLAQPGYSVRLPVPPGSYDILCRGGMEGERSFLHAGPATDILESQNTLLRMKNGISNDRLEDLYHGLLLNATFTDNNLTGTAKPQTATIRLTKNTNRINLILHNLDGTPMDPADFHLSIKSKNAEMAYDNSLSPGRDVTYHPWHITPIYSDIDPAKKFRGDTAPRTAANGKRVSAGSTAFMAEFSMARLLPDGGSRLDIKRSDGERIISIPLERNLLLYKGEFHADMTDAAYLDRQDDYTLTFILDPDNNWNAGSMIYINDWATLPIQYQEW